MALDENKRLWAWGGNESGCLCVGDGLDRYAPMCVPGSQEWVLEKVVCGYSHTILLSAYSAGEVQSRRFYMDGMLHLDELVSTEFCMYSWSASGRYYPLSVIRNFFQAHNFPMSPDPIFCVDTGSDQRLADAIERVQAFAFKGETTLEKVKIIALAVFYEYGGAQSSLNEVSSKHVSLLMERLPEKSGIVPIGAVRVGDSRHRAVLTKLVCDRMGIPCALVRGAVPDVDRTGGFFDLSTCTLEPEYKSMHHWNFVKLQDDTCYLVDTVGVPTDVREVENSQELMAQIGQADFNVP
mmetsp:Transcript_6945/g.10931  ORF Transcript_6945/g.10931 Transcript_6945/m.10931 type:complete len:295 (-) Transcript_6945:62-946(-)